MYTSRVKERISCFDIDGTLSKGLLFVPLVESEHDSGHLSGEAFEEINKLILMYKSGKLEYEVAVESLLQAHANGLRGESHQALKMHAERFLESHEAQLFHKFCRGVINTLKPKHRLFVVTAEPQYLAEAVADMFGINGFISSVYAGYGDKFTGRVERSLAHRTAKAALLQNYNIEYAFGDSEGDIDMLRNAKYPYAISPTSGLQTIAKEQGWHVFDGNDTQGIVDRIKATD